MSEVIVKIGLERINIQKEIIVEALLDSRAIVLIISSEFVKKKRFKLKRIEKIIYVRNINRIFNKERPIEYTVEVNIHYQKYRKRMEINVISKQKWNIILEIL